MITEEEYEKAQRIVDQYQREQQQQADLDLEDEQDTLDNYDDNDDEYDSRYMCKCGAWEPHPTTGKLVHLADCICGAE